VDGNELKEDLSRRIGSLLQDESFDLWDLEFASQAGATVVRVFVDRPSGVTLHVDHGTLDCRTLTVNGKTHTPNATLKEGQDLRV